MFHPFVERHDIAALLLGEGANKKEYQSEQCLFISQMSVLSGKLGQRLTVHYSDKRR